MSPHNDHSTGTSIKAALAYRFNLRSDQSSFVDIDKNIRDGIEVRGTNLWVLMLAIFIASIGLDVNSTAVIIGAMLISPIMGPIMGIGYGAGINDYLLIRKAALNLLVCILIGLFTSTLYFLISPLSNAQSELLARTNPTIWDVLIALFGGLAGIIASTRKEKSNVIPGVAIATALMPPLCTAGYAIANGQIEMFLGAFYLFFINSVFIAFATLLLVSYLNPPHKQFVSKELEKKVTRYIYIVVFSTLLPSVYLAYGLVNKEIFISRANEFIKQELSLDNSFIAKQQVLPERKEIEISFVGQKISDEMLSKLSSKLKDYKLPNARLVIQQTVVKELDEETLKKTLLTEVLSASENTVSTKSDQIQRLTEEVNLLRDAQTITEMEKKDQEKIVLELMSLYPDLISLTLAKSTQYKAKSDSKTPILLVNISAKKGFDNTAKNKVSDWLKIRTGIELVKVTVEKG